LHPSWAGKEIRRIGEVIGASEIQIEEGKAKELVEADSRAGVHLGFGTLCLEYLLFFLLLTFLFYYYLYFNK
jgi:hypothetical protein